MLVGPVLTREFVTTPRRGRFFALRALYPLILLVVMWTAWLVLTGTQAIHNIGDMARFGAILFQVLVPLQLAIFIFSSALVAAGSIAQEKDRRTLILLLMTRLSNQEIVLGKLFASQLTLYSMLVAGLPAFLAMTLLGGVEVAQIVMITLVTAMAMLAAAALGSTIAFWREKTFQTLAITTLTIVAWLGIWEVVGLGVAGERWGSVSTEQLAICFSPVRAVLAAAEPSFDAEIGWWRADLGGFLLAMAAVTGGMLGVAIWRVRAWNPSREVRRRVSGSEPDREPVDSRQGDSSDSSKPSSPSSQVGTGAKVRVASRRVWDRPVLWREIRTRAYGRKIQLIMAAYVVLSALVVLGVRSAVQEGLAEGYSSGERTSIAATVKPLAPFFLVSIVMINALAVTAITNERDGQTLGVLLATDLSPREFLFGKLGGVLWVTKWMLVMPVLLCGYLWWLGGISLENLAYAVGGLLVLDFFAAMLGLHCGMNYSNSRQAIGMSLGTVFFLFLGVVTCILMMVSFSGSFQGQLAPFLGFIFFGGVGLYISLGSRNPSPAIAAASLVVPFATFYAITSFVLGHTLGLFLVTALAYSFTTAAMMVPALAEFDIAMGRTSHQED